MLVVGWEWVKASFINGWKIIHAVKFKGNDNPDPVMASHKQHWRRLYHYENTRSRIFPNVDNWGHLDGFLGGHLLTRTPWFDPQRPQHIYHLLLGLGLILLSFFSIVASIVLVPTAI